MAKTKNQASLIQREVQSSIICDGRWKISSWSEEAARQFGFKEADALGKRLTDFILSPFSTLPVSPTLEELIGTSKLQRSDNIRFYAIATHIDHCTFPVEIIAMEMAANDSYTITTKDLIRRSEVENTFNREYLKLKIINTILKISLEPYLLKEKLAQILKYIISVPKLNLMPQASIFLFEQDPNILSLTAHQGLRQDQVKACETVKLGQCTCGKAAKSGRVLLSKIDQQHETTFASLVPHYHYAIPIKTDDHVIGVLNLSLPETCSNPKKNKELFISISEIIASIIENQKMDLQLINLVNDLRGSIIKLREEKKFSESIIQGLDQGLVVSDLDGTILKSNSVAQKILSPFHPEIEGKKLADIVGEKSAKKLTKLEDPHQINPIEKELTLTTRTNESIIVSCSTVSREDAQGNLVGLIISLTDISEIKYARKEMEKMNRLSTVAEIASAVAHEVRNPLAGIKIMAQSIEEGTTTAGEQEECAHRITRQVDRLNKLLTDFFSYARPVVPQKKLCSFPDILAETQPLIHNKLTKKGTTLIEKCPENLPPIVADPNQVQQVFLNLMLNAIDATRKDGVIEITANALTQASLSMQRRQHPGLLQGPNYIMVTFSDNGIGMDKKTADKVFEPFFTTKTTGAGLGLSIVYRTLKENDASIFVNSKEGIGTTFKIFFKTT